MSHLKSWMEVAGRAWKAVSFLVSLGADINQVGDLVRGLELLRLPVVCCKKGASLGGDCPPSHMTGGRSAHAGCDIRQQSELGPGPLFPEFRGHRPRLRVVMGGQRELEPPRGVGSWRDFCGRFIPKSLPKWAGRCDDPFHITLSLYCAEFLVAVKLIHSSTFKQNLKILKRSWV